MENYRKSAHCTYDIKYHIVWITKYRKPVLTGKIGTRTRELIRAVCKGNEVEILSGHVSKDHVHLLVSVPPHLSASKLVQYIKGYSSRKLQMEYKEINKYKPSSILGKPHFPAHSRSCLILSRLTGFFLRLPFRIYFGKFSPIWVIW